MKYTKIICILLSFMVAGCATQGAAPAKTQLEAREFQTRSYATKDEKMVLKAVLNVLQDDGFIIKEANSDLGVVTASKEVDVENRTGAIFATLMFGAGATWNKNSTYEASVNVSERGEETRVRVIFQVKTMNNKGGVASIAQVSDEKSYTEFFSMVDKGVFIEKEGI